MNAIILAGGKGSRLQPWHAPKCLLPINGVPMLHRLLARLIRNGIEHSFICVGYRANDVSMSLLPETWAFVSLVDAGEDATMGVRLGQLRERAGRERVLICYGDELADVDVAELVKTHEQEKNWMTFTCYQAKVPGGEVLVVGDAVRIQEDRPHLVNIGFVVVEPQAWEMLQPEDGLSDWINRISESGIDWDEAKNSLIFRRPRVGVYLHKGKRATVNSLADLAHAEETWR